MTSMDAWEALAARRQVREYTADPVDDELLNRVLDAGRRSPSARNNQPWHFVVVTDQATKEGLATTWMGAGWIPAAPVVVAVLVDRQEDERRSRIAEYDLGQCVSSMFVAATALGLGSGQTSVLDQDLARSLLGSPATVDCSKLLTFGHPTTPLAPLRRVDRRPFDEVVHRERW